MDAFAQSFPFALGHSATVQMILHIDADPSPVAGENAIKLRDRTDLSPGPASLEIAVDGKSHFQPSLCWLEPINGGVQISRPR